MPVYSAVESDFSLRKLKIAGICLMGQLFGSSMLLVGPLSMILRPMTEEFGWSRSQFSLSNTAAMWAGALALPFIGRLIDRRGVRPVVLTGTGILGLLSLVLAAQKGSLWFFCLLFALVGVFGAVMIGYGKVMGALFTQHRGKAMAGVAALSPVIASIFPQISNQLLEAFGWRGIFAGYGIVILVTDILLFFLLEEPAGSPVAAGPRPAPAEKNLSKSAPATPVMEGITTAEALRGRTLWILMASGLVAGILGAGWSLHSFDFQRSRGFSQQMVTNALTFSLLITPVAVMLGGWLLDKVQTAKIKIPFILMAALGIYFQSIVWVNYGGVPLLFAAVTLGAMAMNAQMPMLSYFYTRFFGMKAFGEIAGINMAVIQVVGGISAPLIGMLYDRNGTYDQALIYMIVGYVLSALLYLAIGRYRYTTDFKVIPVSGKARKEKTDQTGLTTETEMF